MMWQGFPYYGHLLARRRGTCGTPEKEADDLLVAPARWELPVFEEVLAALPALEIARLGVADRYSAAATEGAKPRLLTRRGFHMDCSWRKAHAVESALFRDASNDHRAWTPGPNERSIGNIIEYEESDGGPWLWLTRGTDWQAFQGGSQVVSEVGIRPRWVSFRVRIATPELSAANLALSSHQHTWGLSVPTLLFRYRGDDVSSQRRCFMIEMYSPHAQPSRCRLSAHACHVADQVRADRVYQVAVHLDWSTGLLSLFIDGRMHLCRAAFDTSMPIRIAAIYNWRSEARTAFSELILGDTCPYSLKDTLETPKRLNLSCPRRWQQGSSHMIQALVVHCWIFMAICVGVAAYLIQSVPLGLAS